VIDRIVSPLGRRIDDASPMVDARLADGSRVNAVIRPLSVKGSSLTIRRFMGRLLGPQDLVAKGSATHEMLQLLELAVTHRFNIVVAGGTGSGENNASKPSVEMDSAKGAAHYHRGCSGAKA